MTREGSGTPAISCRNISVSFGEVKALSEVAIDFPKGKIHAVVGQNGAGKTTLARVFAGLARPDSGSLAVNGKDLGFGDVTSARAAGIELVHQSFALPPSFTVAEAIEFASGGGIGFYRRKNLLGRCGKHLDALGIDLEPYRRIRDLPIEQQQAVEIARALASRAGILILDEPTAVLPPPGIESLFERVRKLKDNGVTIILILHKTREIWAIADTITVLSNGRLVAGPLHREQTDPGRIGRMIVSADIGNADLGGHAVPEERTGGTKPESEPPAATGRDMALELSGIVTADTTDHACLRRISLSVRPGEIVGVAGVEGNGQVTLVRAIAGLAEVSEGEIEILGKPATNAGLARRRSLGLRIIPFDRNGEGLSLTSELWQNWAAGELAALPLLSLINPANIRARCRSSMSNWSVRYSSATQTADSLSGGNAQKLILSRELDDAAGMIVAAQPTRGLDIGATAFVWSTLRRARARGCGILLISSDLDELFEISDRVLVMLSGRIVGELEPPYDHVAAGRAMIGAAA